MRRHRVGRHPSEMRRGGAFGRDGSCLVSFPSDRLETCSRHAPRGPNQRQGGADGLGPRARQGGSSPASGQGDPAASSVGDARPGDRAPGDGDLRGSGFGEDRAGQPVGSGAVASRGVGVLGPWGRPGVEVLDARAVRPPAARPPGETPSTADPGSSLVEGAIDELAEAASEADDVLVLVLDNVHHLSDPEVIGSLDAVLRHPPPNLRVVMTALSDPIIPLHRYRLQGNLSEIRAAELAMTNPEVEQLFAAHDIRLSASQVEVLAERTEGWVAGLCLSALQMEGSSDPERLVTDLRDGSGQHRGVPDGGGDLRPTARGAGGADPVQYLRPDLGSAGGRHL